MNHIIQKNITCDNCVNCSDTIIDKLEKKFNCKLMGVDDTDTVNGSVSILHIPNEHIVTIVFYDHDEASCGEHKMTFKKCDKTPTEQECIDCLS